MRYTGIPRYIRQEMIRKRKREEDFNVRKLNKPYPAYTIGEEVVDFVFAEPKDLIGGHRLLAWFQSIAKLKN